MLLLEEEQGSPAPGAIERTLLDHAYCTGPGGATASRHEQARYRTVRCGRRQQPAFTGPPIRASAITSCVRRNRVEGRCDLGHLLSAGSEDVAVLGARRPTARRERDGVAARSVKGGERVGVIANTLAPGAVAMNGEDSKRTTGVARPMLVLQCLRAIRFASGAAPS
jgi:hypothetical protein